jgi:polyisoprenyl-teichoic acid--peptidoglycan teichoic acid transferase
LLLCWFDRGQRKSGSQPAGDRDADSYFHGNSHRGADRNYNQHPHHNPDLRLHLHPHAYSDRDAYPYGHVYANHHRDNSPNSYPHPNRNGDTRTDRNGYPDPDRHAYPYKHPDRHSNGNPNRNADGNRHRSAYGDRDSSPAAELATPLVVDAYSPGLEKALIRLKSMRKIHVLAVLSLGPVLLAACRPEALPLTERPVITASSTPTHLILPPTPTPEPVHFEPTGTPPPSGASRPAIPLTPAPSPAIDEPLFSASPTGEIPIPAPAEPLPLPEGVQVLALLGADDQGSGAGRTDSILLVFYHLQNGTASLVSIPRDLYVYLPGREMDRINTAFFWGGFDLLAGTLEYNLGVHPDHWVLVRFGDFIRFVDDLGGVTVPVSDPLPDDCGGIPPGAVHMDGSTALCYLRERRTTSDIARSRRQQEVLGVILDRFIAFEHLRNLPLWYEHYREAVRTDLTLENLLAFIPFAIKLQDAGLRKYQIGWEQVEPRKLPDNGAEVFLPKRGEIQALLIQAIAGLDAAISDSPALQARLAALTATATLTPEPAGESLPEIEIPTETPLPTPALAETTPPSLRDTPTLAPSDRSP